MGSTLDEWHVLLFGQDAKEPEHDARHSLIETMLWKITSRALELGTNVILDFGFWARAEREDYRLRAKQLGASSEVHFLDVSEDELLRRLEARNSQPSPESFYIPVEMMRPWIEFFQRPTPDELVRRE
jgi:predicted kinase